MTPLALRRRLYRLCGVHWPRLTALFDTWKADRSDAYVDLEEQTRKAAILEFERQSELDRVSKILRVSGHHYPTTRRSGLLGKGRP